jgi:hypothetical protein
VLVMLICCPCQAALPAPSVSPSVGASPENLPEGL